MTRRAPKRGADRPPDMHHPAADWDQFGYKPSPNTPLLRCWCGAAWLDDDEGRHAHRVVFSHQPKPAEPSSPPKETSP